MGCQMRFSHASARGCPHTLQPNRAAISYDFAMSCRAKIRFGLQLLGRALHAAPRGSLVAAVVVLWQRLGVCATPCWRNRGLR